MQQDYRKLTLDMQRRAAEVARVIQRDVPAYIAVAWERMKDANFSAQGFVRGGSAAPRWDKRKKETPLTSGKRILHATGTLQASVHFTPGAGDWCRRTKIPAAWENRPAWVDLGKVPYARIHNEGGRVSQYVRPFSRRLVSPNRNTGSLGKPSRRGHPVSGFFRRATYPCRQYLGISPDIFISAHKDIAYAIRRALNSH